MVYAYIYLTFSVFNAILFDLNSGRTPDGTLQWGFIRTKHKHISLFSINSRTGLSAGDIMDLMIIIPIVLLSFCIGVLMVGSIIFFYVYLNFRRVLYLAVLIVGILGLMTLGSELLVVICGYTGMGQLGMQFHRLEAVSITLFLFALPFAFHNFLELNSTLRRVNKAVYTSGLVTALVIIATAYVFPDLFLSFNKKPGTVITPWNVGRAAPGIVYRIRDLLTILLALYSIGLMLFELRVTRQQQYVRSLLLGLLVGTGTGAADLLLAMKEFDTGLYSIRIFSVFSIGLAVFIIMSMSAIMRLYIDQTNALEKARRNEYLELLAGGIAHDFNNILTGILGSVSLVRTSGDDPNRELFDEIKKAALRAKNLTQQLLTFSRGGVLHRQVISLSKLITETVGFLLHGSSISVEYAISPDLWNVDVDSDKISQMVQNIVINAKEAMSGGGILRITAKNHTVANGNPLLATGKYLKIEFRDTGIGIRQGEEKKLFEPYFSTKKTGAGLGLAISHSIVRAHRGHIEVSSMVGEGSTFTVYLPATEDPIVEKEHAGGITDRPVAQMKGRVLLMDDEEPVLRIGNRMLAHMGFETVCVGRGEDAISSYREAMDMGNPFNLVIMDLTIAGGMGGKETVKEIRNMDPGARVLVATGYSQDLVVSDYRKFGFSGAIVKPYTVDDLREAIERILDK